MATDSGPVGKIVQIKQVHLDLNDEQLRYDALMANAEATSVRLKVE